jgi:hypothetical protein
VRKGGWGEGAGGCGGREWEGEYRWRGVL